MKHTIRSKKLLGVPVWLLSLIIIGMVGTGALISGIMSFTMSQSGNIDTTGETPSLLYFDGVLLTEATTNIPMDVTYMESGDGGEMFDDFEFNHTFLSPAENGDYIITFNVSNMTEFIGIDGYGTGCDETHEFYGFEFHVWNIEGQSLLGIGETLTVLAGEGEVQVSFQYSLHDDFWHTENPIPFNLIIEAELI